MNKPTLQDVLTHLMDHVQDLSKLQHQLLGIKRQVLTSYQAVDEILNTKGLKGLHVSPERLRDLIENEEDLPVEVGTPFRPNDLKRRRIDGTATYEGDEWRFEEDGIVGDPKATLFVERKGNDDE